MTPHEDVPKFNMIWRELDRAFAMPVFTKHEMVVLQIARELSYTASVLDGSRKAKAFTLDAALIAEDWHVSRERVYEAIRLLLRDNVLTGNLDDLRINKRYEAWSGKHELLPSQVRLCKSALTDPVSRCGRHLGSPRRNPLAVDGCGAKAEPVPIQAQANPNGCADKSTVVPIKAQEARSDEESDKAATGNDLGQETTPNPSRAQARTFQSANSERERRPPHPPQGWDSDGLAVPADGDQEDPPTQQPSLRIVGAEMGSEDQAASAEPEDESPPAISQADLDKLTNWAQRVIGPRGDGEFYTTKIHGWCLSYPKQHVRDAILITAAAIERVDDGRLASFTAGTLRRLEKNDVSESEIATARAKVKGQSTAKPSGPPPPVVPPEYVEQMKRNCERQKQLWREQQQAKREMAAGA